VVSHLAHGKQEILGINRKKKKKIENNNNKLCVKNNAISRASASNDEYQVYMAFWFFLE
jgi:hypothetical protein